MQAEIWEAITIISFSKTEKVKWY